MAMHVVLFEFADEFVAIGPCELSVTVFLTIYILALVLGAVSPRFYSESMLLILVPAALVASTIFVHIDALAMRLVIFPHADVHVSVAMN